MFREKYKADNELIKAPEKLSKEVYDMRPKTIRYMRIAAIAACVLIAAAAIFMLPGRQSQAPVQTDVRSGEQQSIKYNASDYADIYDSIVGMRQSVIAGGGFYFGAVNDGMVMEEAAEDYSADTDKAAGTRETGAAGAGRDDYSKTNTQFENVDEGDIIKTDGRYIYRRTGSDIVIVDALEMQVVSRITPFEEKPDGSVDGWVEELYISADRLAAVYTKMTIDEKSWWADTSTGVLVYDISERSEPKLIGDYSQSGSLSASRLIDGYIYLVTGHYVYGEPDKGDPKTYVPIIECGGTCRPVDSKDIMILPEPISSQYTVITSLSIDDGTDFDSVEAVFGCGSTVYADEECVILSFRNEASEEVETQENGESVTISSGSDETTLVRYDISDGRITYAASGSVPGSLLNQFSVDRYNGIVRVVTTVYTWEQKIYTDGIDRYEFENSTTNGLYTLDKDLKIIGKLDGLAEDERVYSVRFSGDIGYFVTFRQVDPLYAVDLSDPTAPKILSALKIPGFSQYMHPYASGLLFGLGMDADEETGITNGLKLSMFDTSDPADVTEVHKLVLDNASWSEALYNHKAIVVSAERDIIAFPAEGGYVIYGYGENGFYERFELDVGELYYPDVRGLFIGDSFYICTAEELSRYDLDTFELVEQIEII